MLTARHARFFSSSTFGNRELPWAAHRLYR